MHKLIQRKKTKINIYQQRVSQFQQNRFFTYNESQFYKQIDGNEKGEEIIIPDAQEAKTFLTGIWGHEVEHNKDAKWLREIKKDMNGKNNCAGVQIPQEKLKKILKMISNWKEPGPDGVHGFLLKNFTSLHQNLIWHLNACLEGETPQWMMKGRTVLVQKS